MPGRELFISSLSYEQQNSLVEYMAERSLEDCVRTVKDALQTEELPRYMEASIDFFVVGCIRTWQGWACPAACGTRRNSFSA